MAPIDDIAAIIKEAIIGALEDRQDELMAVAANARSTSDSGVFSDVGSLIGIIGGIIGAAPVVGELLGVPLAPVQAVEDAAGKSGLAIGLGWLLGNIGMQAMAPVFQPLNHAVASELTSDTFDPMTAAALVSKGIAPPDWAAGEAAGQNLDGQHFNMLVDAAGNRPTFDIAGEMLRRQLITQTDFATALARNDIPPYWWDAYQGLLRQLLSPADLALAVLRGELPMDDATAYAAQLGILDTDFQTLINNTGEPPGAEQMMEALRRDFIDEPTFTRAILQSRIRDEWVPTMLALRYSPMATADAIRAVVENYITSDQGAAIAQQNGLEPDHWPILVESWGRPLAHEQMMKLYHMGEVSLDDVHQAFRESDLKDKYIDDAVLLGRTLVPERMTVSMLQHGVISDQTAQTMLAELGYNADDAQSLIALGGAEHATTHKTLTKADVLAMYTDSLIPRADALSKLEAMGYSTADSTDELDLADFKAKAATVRIIKTGVEAELKAHDLQPADAIQQLMNAGLDQSQAKMLVDQWTLQKQTATRGLTEAQILKLAEDALLAPEDALSRLLALGLVRGDAVLLLLDKGVKVS